MSDALTPDEPVGDTVVPGGEDGFDHAAQPTPESRAFTAGYCATCGTPIVTGLGGWQHAPEPTA